MYLTVSGNYIMHCNANTRTIRINLLLYWKYIKACDTKQNQFAKRINGALVIWYTIRLMVIYFHSNHASASHGKFSS